MEVLLPNKSYRLEKEIWIGKKECPVCKAQRDFHLVKLMYGSPGISSLSNTFIMCDYCSDAQEITYYDFKKIKKVQEKSLSEGKFPAEIIRQDYNVTSLNLNKKRNAVFLLFLLPLFLLLACLPGLLESSSIDLALVAVILGVCILVSIPALLALKSFNDAKKKHKMYYDFFKE